jgi:integrase
LATIKQRGERQWRVRVRKKGIIATATFETKALAERWAKSKETEIEEGRFVPTAREADRVTLAQALDRYLLEVTPRKKGAEQEEKRIRQWQKEAFAKKPFSRVISDDLVQWRNRRQTEGRAPSTISNSMNLLSAVYRHAASEWQMQGLINPAAGVRRPAARAGRNVQLSAEQEGKIIEACRANRLHPWLPYIVRLAIETAMRAGELRSLHWADIKGRVAHLEDTKNGESRDVPLSKAALSVLEEMKQDPAVPRQIDGTLFPVGRELLSAIFAKAADDAGMPDLRFHDLRHVAATRISGKLPNTLELAAVTGHKTLQVLKRYYNPDIEQLAAKLD